MKKYVLEEIFNFEVTIAQKYHVFKDGIVNMRIVLVIKIFLNIGHHFRLILILHMSDMKLHFTQYFGHNVLSNNMTNRLRFCIINS